MLKNENETTRNNTYYIGFKARWERVDYQLFVFQWKSYDPEWTGVDTIPACLIFKEDKGRNRNRAMYVCTSVYLRNLWQGGEVSLVVG